VGFDISVFQLLSRTKTFGSDVCQALSGGHDPILNMKGLAETQIQWSPVDFLYELQSELKHCE